MGHFVKIDANDGHTFNIYYTEPTGTPRGILVIVQEIFGVTAHIRELVDRYAQVGYFALAPAFYDRVGPGIELTPAQFAQAREYTGRLKDEQVMADMSAAISYAAKYTEQNGFKHLKTVAVGYCWGGTTMYLAACRLPIAAAVSYYGTRTTQYLSEHPRCPMLYHFGELDTYISQEAIAQIRAADPEGIFHVYPGAKHAFNNDQRPDNYHPQAAQLAWERSLEFLSRHLS